MSLLANLFARTETVEHEIVRDVERFDDLVLRPMFNTWTTDAAQLFTAAHDAAMAANEQVNQLKADLQVAVVNARDLHAAAVSAANTALATAEADVAKYKAAVASHTEDWQTHASQITTPKAE